MSLRCLASKEQQRIWAECMQGDIQFGDETPSTGELPHNITDWLFSMGRRCFYSTGSEIY